MSSGGDTEGGVDFTERLAAELTRVRAQLSSSLAALTTARIALECTAIKARICLHNTALTSWPKQLAWTVSEVKREADAGIKAINVALVEGEKQ